MFDGRDLPTIHDRPPLLDFIRQQLGPDQCLPDPTCSLPDDEPRTPSELGWMAGALDGVMGHHAAPARPAPEVSQQLARSIAAAADRPGRRELSALYEQAASADVLSSVDSTIEALAALEPSATGVAGVGTWLASASPDRAPVKLGIALLGVTGAPDGSLLHELGAHEEFTLYAAVAFVNARQDPDPDLWALAKRVRGWGRIHCVERLRHTTDASIARWILVEGFRNSVMDEYLVHTAATTGRLADALAEPAPDRAVLDAAGDIIRSLISGGPAQDIDDYPLAPTALARFLDHMDHRAETLRDLLAIATIRDFCDEDDWDARLEGPTWTPATHALVRAHAVALLDHPRWPSLIRSGLDGADPRSFWTAEQAARALGIDAFGRLLRRLDADPFHGPWFQAWRGAGRDRAQVLVERAAALLDLGAIATGPSAAIGMGPEFARHSALNWTLQELRRHPGLGADVVAAALRSPSIQNRNGALNVLEAWGRGSWSDRHGKLLADMASTDPDDKVRARAAALFAR